MGIMKIFSLSTLQPFQTHSQLIPFLLNPEDPKAWTTRLKCLLFPEECGFVAATIPPKPTSQRTDFLTIKWFKPHSHEADANASYSRGLAF